MMNRLSSILLPVVLSFLMFSCSKSTIENPQPKPVVVDSLEVFAKLKDSASYIIDGQFFQCTSLSGNSGGNEGANLDTINRRWSIDTTQFHVGYTFTDLNQLNPPNLASLEINFVKNFKNTDLGAGPLPGIKWPSLTAQMQMFALGQHPYTLDYKRYNYQSGVAITVKGPNKKYWSTFIKAYAYTPTTIAPDSHANAVFEVTRLQKLRGNGYDYFLEARFSATIFDENEQSKKLEKGYLRVRLSDY